jgi:signal peptidase I
MSIRWPATSVRVTAAGLLSWLAATLFWALVPGLVGLHSEVVMSGSMSPHIRTGDVVATVGAAPSALRPGWVLLFDDPDRPGRVRLHRLLRRTPEGLLVTKGDANAQPDPTPIAASAVRGVARVRIPFAGLPKLWFTERHWALLAAFAAVVAGLIVLATRAPER